MIRNIKWKGRYLSVLQGNQEEIALFVKDTPGLYISLNLEALANDELLELSRNQSVYYYVDGIGASFILFFCSGSLFKKVPGCELWVSVLKLLAKSNNSPNIALIGATDSVNSKVITKIYNEFPEINIAYRKDGYSPIDFKSLADLPLQACFVALGQPRQEIAGYQIYSDSPNIRVLGLGGSFDVYVGEVKRAPSIFIKLHLEWLYRIAKQPFRASRLIYAFKKLLS